MISAKEYVKLLSTSPSGFIDEFFEFYNDETMQTDFVIKLEVVCKWLKATKEVLARTLRKTHKENIDYIITKPTDIVKKDPRHNNYRQYLLTPDCFKQLAMMSRSKNAHLVRSYFIDIENLFIRYRKYTLAGMQKEIEDLERNQRSKPLPVTGPGFIYIISAGKQGLYKIGRTKGLANRIRNYQSGLADDIEILYVYQTDNIAGVEGCVKLWLKEKRYRKYKEVYQADIDLIKMLIKDCGKMGAKLYQKQQKNVSKPDDNHYIVISADK